MANNRFALSPDNGKRKIFFGWKVVLGAFIAEMTGTIPGPPVFGFFIIPMTRSMGIGRGAFTLAYSLRAVFDGMSGPIVGRLVDHQGPRMLMAFGSFFTGLAIMSLSGVTSFWHLALACSVLGAAEAPGISRMVTLVTVARWFTRKRGRATAIATAGFSLGIATIAPIAQALIAAVGWQVSWVILGVAVWILMIPTSLAFMRKSPESMGLRPDGDNSVVETGSGAGGILGEELVWTLQMALRTRALWLMAFAILMGATAVPAVTFHQAPAILDKGFGAPIAATAVLIFGLSATASKLIFGFLVERIPVQYLFIVCLAGSGGALYTLVVADTLPMVLIYAFVYGSLRGAFPTLEAVVWADYFGRTYLGTIRGTFQPLILIARAGGPLLAGVLFDLTGSYDIALQTCIVMLIFGALAMVFAPAPTHPSKVRL